MMGFNAWDAGQSLYLTVLKELVQCFEKGEETIFDADLKNALQQLLENKALDKALLARMLSLPSKSYLAEQYESIPVDAIIKAHNFLEQVIANTFYELFKTTYLENCIDQEYQPNAQQVAQRSLKNLCLRYIARSNHEEAIALAQKQFETADNMTDQSAGFRALVFCDVEFAQPAREKSHP